MKFMNKISLLLALTALPVSALASTIAIIDSGSDYKHKDLVTQYGVNATPNQSKDFKDDVYGWNFAENNNQVIDYSYLEKLKPSMPDIHKLFEVQIRILDKTASAEDIAWYKAKVADEAFFKQLEIFGNFAHGTHVAGITGGHSTTIDPNNHPFAVKIIPTEVKLPASLRFVQSDQFRAMFGSENPVKLPKINIPVEIREMLFPIALGQLAAFQTKIFGKAGGYVNLRKADVANGSFGVGSAQLKTVVETLYNLVFKEEERNPAKLEEFTKNYANQIVLKSKVMVDASPGTLFVFAAGNDGTNNDVLPTSPANIRADNSLAVAATLRNRELAVFSNYGMLVDVAAPGVGIHSLYPGDDHGYMTGTSQAAPYVAGVAASAKNFNPNLKPSELKSIIIDTVDVKPWLQGKVKSSGIVNPERAYEAARLTATGLSATQAAIQARAKVADQVTEEAPAPTPANPALDMIGILPLVSPID